MSTPTQGSGALASVTGFLSQTLQRATPVVQSYLDYRAARESAPSQVVSAYQETPAQTAQAAPSTAAPAAPVPLTARPWFPYAVGGAALLLLVGGIALFRGRRR